jgi:hypothetical protein
VSLPYVILKNAKGMILADLPINLKLEVFSFGFESDEIVLNR